MSSLLQQRVNLTLWQQLAKGEWWISGIVILMGKEKAKKTWVLKENGHYES